MTDSFVKVLESTDPAAKQVDNDQTTTGAGTVYRQRIAITDGADVAQGATTDADTASTVIGRLKKMVALLAGGLPAALGAGGGMKVEGVAGGTAQPVSGTVTANAGTGPFPVSDNAGSLTVDAPVATPVAARLSDGAAFIDPRDVSDRSARLVGVVSGGANVFHVDDNAGLLSVDDGAGSLTVDAPVGTPVFVRLSDGAAALAGQKTMALSLPVTLASDQTVLPVQSEERAANLAVTVTAATGVAATLTLPAPAAGLFHYISLIEIELYATAARTGGATPVLVTTTNLPGSPVWDFDTGQAIGTTIRKTLEPSTPIKSSVAATATTIVAPIATTGIWRINAYYFTAV